jgi:hypothetical protein
VKESCLVKLSNESSYPFDHFSFLEEIFSRGNGAYVLKAAWQVLCSGDFERQGKGPVKKRKDCLLNGANRLDGKDSARPDLFCQGQFLKGP